VLARAHTYEFDADPDAFRRIGEVADRQTRQQLSGWLRQAADGHRQLVIKDPRSVWLHELWAQAAADSGLSINYLTMLRHPTEVVGSRSTYYGKARDERSARDYAISKVAGWINVSLLNESLTRGRPRVYLRYTDLLADWRTALTEIGKALQLTYDTDLSTGDPHPVDDFISPELHRIHTGWEDLDVPPALRDLAEEVWAACGQLADEGGDTDLADTFSSLSRRYAALYRDAAAIAHDTTTSAVSAARAALEDQLARERKARKAAERALRARTETTVGQDAAELGRRVARGLRRRVRRGPAADQG
jgi:hypothetical protein